MSHITADFPLLPDTNQADWIATYETVYAQLAAMGLPTPGQPVAVIGRSGLLKHLQKLAGQAIKEELKKTDKPDYSGKSDNEQAALLNDWREESVNAPPVNYALTALPFAPNSLSADDVNGAKQDNGWETLTNGKRNSHEV